MDTVWYVHIHLEGGKGEHICLNFRDDKKLTASGGYHIDNFLSLTSHTSGDDYRLSIGCSMGKTFEQIAKDIQRRLLPTYLADFQKAYENYHRYHNKQVAQNQLLNRLGDIAGLKPVTDLNTKKLGYFGPSDRKSWRNSLEVDYDGSINLVLNDLTESEATTILNLLNDLWGR